MIKLNHIHQCRSVLTKNLNLSGESRFITDTRKFRMEDSFVAIPGQKVNPLTLLEPMLSQGCQVVVYEFNDENELIITELKTKYGKTKFIGVESSVTFLQELTHEHIKEWRKQRSSNTVFAISGSNGKTTHKEMLSHILKKINPDKVVATEKNNNNHLGVPLTLLDVTSSTETVVLELGSNHPGEIKVLCDIAVPNAGLTTNIGATHLEFFGTEEQVFDEEGYLYHAVMKETANSGLFLLNMDDKYLSTLRHETGVVSFSTVSPSDIVYHVTKNGVEFVFRGESFEVKNDFITGTHNKTNLATSVLIAYLLYPQLKEVILKVASEFQPTKNRSEWIQKNQTKIFLDAYNANPSSMRAALLGFKESLIESGKDMKDALVILGDMNELGEQAPRYHEEIGHYVSQLGFKNVVFVGRFSSSYHRGCPLGEMRNSASEFKREFKEKYLDRFPLQFVKGSRSLQLESLFDIT